MSELPPFLYHGTSEARYQAMLAAGELRPRGEEKGNWAHTEVSHPEAIYLTQCYALYFAVCATEDDGVGIVLEVSTESLDRNRLAVDEDALALAGRKDANSPRKATERAARAKQIMPMGFEAALESLRVMGTCAYLGIIPMTAVRRVLRIDWKQSKMLRHQALEPVISPMNYKLFGAGYEKLTHWAFGDPPTPDVPIRFDVVTPSNRDGLQVLPLPQCDTRTKASR